MGIDALIDGMIFAAFTHKLENVLHDLCLYDLEEGLQKRQPTLDALEGLLRMVGL